MGFSYPRLYHSVLPKIIPLSHGKFERRIRFRMSSSLIKIKT